jgi:phosphate-selective porin OprO/OprP
MKFNKKLAVAVSGAVLLMAGQFALADSTTDIVDALVSKGVLTEEEGKLISKGHETKKKAEGTTSFNNGFKINSGDGKSNFSVNGRIQADYRYFDSVRNNGETAPSGTGAAVGGQHADTFDMRRAYLTAKGTFRGFINFEATLDAGAAGADSSKNSLLKYYWLETAFSDAFKVRFGQYKMPGSLEQLTSSRFIDMTERDWVASLAPAVNKGIMIHGVPATGFTYAVSVSNGGLAADSGATAIETNSGADGKAINGRVTANIAEIVGNKEAIMHLGGWYGYDTDVTNMDNGAVKIRTNARGTGFFANKTGLYSNPDISRGGLEMIGAYGPVKLQGEWGRMSFDQEGRTSRDIDAGYINLSYMITGEQYASAYKNGVMDRMSPKNNYTGFGSSGWGAWEIGARYSKFDAKDFAYADLYNGQTTASGNYTNDADSYTIGLKWIVDPNTRFLANYVYTDFNRDITGGDGATVGSLYYSKEKAFNFRAQFDF